MLTQISSKCVEDPAPGIGNIAESIGMPTRHLAELSGDASNLGTSVAKAVALLEAFRWEPSLGVTELARRAQLSKSTAFRLLGVLEQWDLVERRGTAYQLGKRLFELGNRIGYCRPRSLRDIALPYMVDLFERTHETVHLAVLDGIDVLYIEKLYGHLQVKMPTYVGARVAAHTTSLGKAMLAFQDDPEATVRTLGRLQPSTPYTIVVQDVLLKELHKIKATGYAVDHEEAMLGLSCAAAPILDSRGRAVAAISVAGGAGRFDPQPHVHAMATAAKSIGHAYHQ